jgi:hypothetical protein
VGQDPSEEDDERNGKPGLSAEVDDAQHGQGEPVADAAVCDRGGQRQDDAQPDAYVPVDVAERGLDIDDAEHNDQAGSEQGAVGDGQNVEDPADDETDHDDGHSPELLLVLGGLGFFYDKGSFGPVAPDPVAQRNGKEAQQQANGDADGEADAGLGPHAEGRAGHLLQDAGGGQVGGRADQCALSAKAGRKGHGHGDVAHFHGGAGLDNAGSQREAKHDDGGVGKERSQEKAQPCKYPDQSLVIAFGQLNGKASNGINQTGFKHGGANHHHAEANGNDRAGYGAERFGKGQDSGADQQEHPKDTTDTKREYLRDKEYDSGENKNRGNNHCVQYSIPPLLFWAF